GAPVELPALNETFNATNGTNFTLPGELNISNMTPPELNFTLPPALNISLNLTNATNATLPPEFNFTNATTAPVEQGRKAVAPPRKQPQLVEPGEDEIVRERTPFSRKYELPDGRQQAVLFPVPVQYVGDDGNWYTIDTSITQASEPGYAYGAECNRFKTFFSDNSSQALTELKAGATSVSFSLDNSKEAATEISGSTLQYSGADDGVDITYTVTQTGVKERIVLANASVRRRFDFTLSLQGLEPKRLKDGSYVLIDLSTGAGSFIISKPFAADSQGSISTKFSMNIVRKGAGYALTIAPDTAWLSDPGRAYPVTIDPTITLNTSDAGSDDTHIRDDTPDQNFGQDSAMLVSYIATTGSCMPPGPPFNCETYLTEGECQANPPCAWAGMPGYTARSMLRFNLTPIPAGTAIASANLSVNLERDTLSASVLVAATQITASWNEDNASWTNNSAF
ncbi:MAG: hypothetical protein WC759_03725, partial [Candidatus Micrarchaeia archaeon]